MRKKILTLVLAIACIIQVQAQHVYYRLDIATNNIYTFAVANLATAGLNRLANDMVFDNAYTYTYLQKTGNSEGLTNKGYNVVGLTARDLFSDVTAGGKLGWQSFNPGSFNWGVFASAHYRLNQYKTTIANVEDIVHNNVQRALFGGGVLFNIGDVESSTKVIVEASVRYEIPIHYKGASSLKTSDMLDSGLSSHYAIRINGNGFLQGIGIYADIPHYKLFKKSGATYGTPNIKPYTFGVIYTITPWKIKEIYE